MDTIKHLLSKARRTDEPVGWRKTYADEIAHIHSRAIADNTHRGPGA